MSTRRIGSFLNLSPLQEISINPFSELNSDNINKLTKSISNCEDGVVFGLDVVNPNWYTDSLKHFVISNGIDTDWIYDSTYCTPELKSDKVDGFTFQDITKCMTLTVTRRITLSSLNLQDLKGRNIESKFNLSFHLISGCPKKIIGYINQNNSYIEYPDNEPTEDIILPIIHNFSDNTDYLDISLTFVMDPSDTYTNHIIQETSYSGQSYAKIANLKIEFDIINLKDIQYRIKDNSNDGDYPTQYVHPTHILDITGGIAIKDDTVVDVKGKNKKFFPALRLDLNSNTSWIRNNPYVMGDFTTTTVQQKGFIYNSTEPLELNLGTVHEDTNELTFPYNNHTFIPSDEYVLTSNDYELNIEIDQDAQSITICKNNQILDTEIPECYGCIAYIYSKSTNKIIKKIDDLVYHKDTATVDEYILYGLTQKDLKIGWNNVTQDNIGVKLSAGPVKVSGNKDEYNNETVKWANVVLYYTYYKNPRPNKAYIGLVRDTDLKDLRYREDYIILAKVRFISPNTVDIISYEDRQQIYHSVEKATNISYGSNLTPEEQNFWLDPALGLESVPTTISDAITKLVRWIPQWLDKYDTRVEKSVTHNFYNLFEHDQIVKWVWDDENERGDLKSSGYYINSNSEKTPFCLAAWDEDLKTILKTNFNIEPESTKNPFCLAAWDENLETILSTDFNIDANSTETPYSFAVWNEDLDTIMSKTLEGVNGQVLLYNSNSPLNIKSDWIMNNGQYKSTENDFVYVCNTEDDLENCFNNGIISKEEIFNDWRFFGHNSNGGSNLDHSPSQYGITPGYANSTKDSNGNPKGGGIQCNGADAWIYSKELDLLFNPINSVDYCGYITNKKYSNYDILVRCYQKNTSITYNGTTYPIASDDDFLGFVAGFITDSNGYQHTLSFIRSSGNTGGNPTAYWSCVIDANTFGFNNNNSCRRICVFNTPVSTGSKNWNTCGDGALIHVIREGNIFKAYTSNIIKDGVYDKNNPSLCTINELPNSEIILDLNNLTYKTYNDTKPISITDPMSVKILNLFKNKSSSYGVAALSQAMCSFDFIKWPENKKVIDLVHNKVYEYDGSNWVETTESIYDAFGKGKFSYNSLTKKLFWQKEDEIIQIDISKCKEYNGKNGDVLYHQYNTESEEFLQTILNDDILVCQNPDEVEECKNYKVDYNDIKIKWKSFGHYNNVQFKKDDNYINSCGGRPGIYKWSCNNSSIIQSENTTDYVGFVSDKSYNDYQITTRMWSNNSDNDQGGVVIAFVVDSNNIEHTLSLLRSPSLESHLKVTSYWSLVLDHYKTSSSKILVNKSFTESPNNLGWNKFGDGILIYAKKINNRIIAKTSPFTENIVKSDLVLSNESLIDVTIDQLIEDNPDVKDILELFKNKTRFGFSTISQPNMSFEILNFNILNVPIYDIFSNKIYIHNGEDWVLSDDKPSNHLNYGRLTYNELTGNLFWINEIGDYILISTDFTKNRYKANILETVYPVGSIYIGTQTKCPFDGIFGTWQKISQGKCLFGANDDNKWADKNLGQSVDAGLPKPTITAKSKWRYVSGGGGAEYTIHGGTGASGAGTMKDNNVISTTATVNDDSIYGKSTTVQPPAFVVNIWQRTA